jgi:hypothetical protein
MAWGYRDDGDRIAELKEQTRLLRKIIDEMLDPRLWNERNTLGNVRTRWTDPATLRDWENRMNDARRDAERATR